METTNLTYSKTQFTDGVTIDSVIPTMPTLIIERIHPDAVIPKYASEGDSGMDVYAIEDMYICPGCTGLAKLGFKLDIPRHPFHELGYRWEAQARPRSGVSSKTNLRVANAPGTIDNSYRGEVGIILTNTTAEELAWEHGELCIVQSDYAINLKGARVLNIVDNERHLINPIPEGTIIIKKGDRIAQLVFNEVIRPLQIVEGTVGTSDRGENGFGSTGV